MKQKVISLSDVEMEHVKNRAAALELPVNEFIRRLLAKDMVESPVSRHPGISTQILNEAFNLKKNIRKSRKASRLTGL